MLPVAASQCIKLSPGSTETESTRTSDVALLDSQKSESTAIVIEKGEEEAEDAEEAPCHQFLEMWLPGRVVHVTPRQIETRESAEEVFLLDEQQIGLHLNCLSGENV